MRFSDKLNRACEMRRLTNQRELADLARVSKSSLNRWLAGISYPDVREAIRLARVLEVPLGWLADESDDGDSPLPDLTEDEERVLDFYRHKRDTVGLDWPEAIDALSGAARPTVHGMAKIHPDRDETEAHERRARERLAPKRAETKKKGSEAEKKK